MIPLQPGESTTVGHDVPEADHNLQVGEEVAFVAAAEPPPPPDEIRFRFVNPALDLEGDLLQQGQLVGNPWAVKVEPTMPVGSIKIEIPGRPVRIENNAPHSVFGDQNGDYAPANLPEGTHTIQATAYASAGATGAVLAIHSVTVRVAGVTPPPDPEPGDGPSGFPMPTAPKQGWKFIGRSDFDDEIPLGQWTGDKQGVLMPRPDAARDGQYRDSSERAIYNARKTISQEGSVLVQRLLQEANGQRYAACALLKSGTHPSLRITQCVKVAGPMAGWKMAHLMAVKGSNVASRGEYDLPEGQFRSGANPSGFIHIVGGEQFHFDLPGVGTFYDWHTYTIEKDANRAVTMLFDGQMLGRVTKGITSEAVHFVLQNETLLGGDPIPAKMGEARVLTDWLTVEVPA